ncbi:MAG: glycosyltransferase family 4 protein, partial [Actinomycetota bacterium]
ARLRRARHVFNIQDVFPDAAVQTGAISNGAVIALASWLERVSYRLADAVTVLSDDLADNVRTKLPARAADTVHVIPNFVDTAAITPLDRHTELRRELGAADRPVVLYAGNLGFSQSFDLLVEAARRLPEVTFLVNGDGAARSELERLAAPLANLYVRGFIDPPRLPELLATGDIHVVPLKTGLGRVSVPSKTYSILAAGRPALAAIDDGTAVPRILAESGGGVAVPPDDLDAFLAGLRHLLALDDLGRSMGAAGRAWVVEHASPAAVGAAYSELSSALSAARAGCDRAG